MKDRVLQYLVEKGEATPHEIAESTGYSRQYVQRKLLDLLDNTQVIKIGKPPLVYYQIIEKPKELAGENVEESDRLFLEGQFIEITEDGRLLEGVEAFIYWCQKRKLPVVKTIAEYRKTLEKYTQFIDKDGFIDGTEKVKTTKGIETLHLNALYYLDFYAIERFGKTRMGQLLHFAKQGQNKKLSLQLIQLSDQKINQLIRNLKVEAVGFIPPTIRRDVQFMTLLEKKLQIDVPQIKLIKVKGEIVVPQKALSKIEDRILNARRSIVTSESKHYNRILLIDDAVGSGATLNETAGKLKLRGVAKEVFGVAITGSFKEFEVITEA